MSNYDQDLYTEMNLISVDIAKKLALLEKPTGFQPKTPGKLLERILGYDTRAAEGLAKLTDEQIRALLPEAKGCLKTLEVLQEHGFFPR